jgi:RNA polymerase sigma-70 factor (family 1)
MIHPNNNPALVAAFQNGDEKAFSSLFEMYHKALVFFCYNLISQKEESEDIVASVFFRLWKRRDGLDSINNIRAFLYISARNACLDYLKHIQRKTAAQQRLMHLAENDEDYIDSKIIQTDLMQQVYNEVDHLPEKCRQIFKLIYFDKLTSGEISAHLNISLENIRVQKSIAIRLLKPVLLKKLLLGLFALFLGSR